MRRVRSPGTQRGRPILIVVIYYALICRATRAAVLPMASLITGRKGCITAKNPVTRTTSRNGTNRGKKEGNDYYYRKSEAVVLLLVWRVHFFTFIKLN